ncbi:serine/threonine protein kinase [Saccharopolyspora erythraea]|uniref:serine/threonine-protein kinase n=1 Tax=Saccharopolyspora erythraea TaxID=1836 RepID=UPI001BA48D83|nr:serine/threonine-protein kinase [Saccharopolyspora erythraea]QUH00496.1 serine/threonine protein kinase [Saccharopolyspora erythraea]
MVSHFGPYRVEGLIARGGMGEVLRAYDTRHDRIVALKVLGSGVAADPEYRERFKREALAAARLREPHVIPIHSFGEIDGRLYLDMRLIEGQDVSRLLAAHGPMPPADAVEVVHQIAQALDAAHEEGLVHRDVKPSNIIIGRGGFAYLVDFGIAHWAGNRTNLTTTGIAVGTLDYMAPERFGDGPVDHRADVYSLACVFYQCLTGAKPYAGHTAESLINSHLNRVPPRPSAHNPALPPAFDRVVEAGMSKDPRRRFATAGEFARAARQALTGAVPAPTRKAPSGPGGRRWWPVAAGVAAVALVAGGAALFMSLPPGGNAQGGDTSTPPSPPPKPESQPPRAPGDLGLSVPISLPPCDGGYLVMVGSSVNPAIYGEQVQRYLDQFPGSSYQHSPSTGCESLRTHVDGAEIYSVYYGPFDDEETACARRTGLGGDAFVRRLDHTSPPEHVVSCG